MADKIRIFVISAFIIVLFSSNLFAQEEKNPEITLRTPYNTMLIHLAYLQKDNYQPGKAARALNVQDPTSKKAKKLAAQLKKIYDARGLFVMLEDIPDDPDFRDSVTGKNVYQPFEELPDVFLRKVNGKWRYSKETIANIPELYDQTFPVEFDFIFEYFPEFVYKKFLGMQIWKYIGLLIYFILGFVLYRVFAWFFGILLIAFSNKLKRPRIQDLANNFIKPVARPLSLLLILWMVSIFQPALQLPVTLSLIINYAIRGLIPLTITIIAFRLADFFKDFIRILASKTRTTVDDNLVPLLGKTFKIVVVIFGAIFILQSVGIQITALIAGVSIGGLAIALAAQDTIKHFFGSLTIFTDQPFEVGDWIIFDGGEGMVEEVGIRSTRIRTFYNSLISIPNGKLADSKIDNMGRRRYRRYVAKLSITYDTPPEKIDAFVKGLRKIVDTHPGTWKDYYQVHLNDFGDSAIQILFYIFFDAADWTKELEGRHQVIYEIIKLASELKVRFAFPTQTVHIEDFPEKQPKTPGHDIQEASMETDLKKFEDRMRDNYGKIEKK